MVEPEQEKAKRKEHIQNLFAFDMFCQKRFDDSLQLFAQLETGQFSFSTSSPAIFQCEKLIVICNIY